MISSKKIGISMYSAGLFLLILALLKKITGNIEYNGESEFIIMIGLLTSILAVNLFNTPEDEYGIKDNTTRKE